MKIAVRLIIAAVLFAACIGNESLSAGFPGSLDNGWHTWQTTAADGSELQVYVSMRSDKPGEFRVRSNSVCWDNFDIEANDLGPVDSVQSIIWLRRFIKPQSDLSSDALMAISQHAGELPIEILGDIVKTGTDRELRGEALFWLAQSDNDDAFLLLDRLLSEKR
jgi:hypothetical protein